MNIIQSIHASLLKGQEAFVSLPWYGQLIIAFVFVMLIASAIVNLFRRRD